MLYLYWPVHYTLFLYITTNPFYHILVPSFISLCLCTFPSLSHYTFFPPRPQPAKHTHPLSPYIWPTVLSLLLTWLVDFYRQFINSKALLPLMIVTRKWDGEMKLSKTGETPIKCCLAKLVFLNLSPQMSISLSSIRPAVCICQNLGA
jgi:hypothetical protein